MLEKVTFCAQDEAEKMSGDPDTVVISLVSPGSSPAKLAKGFAAVLQLDFDDVNYPLHGKERVRFPISRGQAAEVVAFLQLWHGMPNGPKRLLVHSESGLSRASAVAQFSAEYLGLAHDQEFTFANAAVLSRLRKAAGIQTA